MTTRDDVDHVDLNRRYWDDHAAASHGLLARGQWSAAQPRWGLWETPESQVGVFPDNVAGMRAIELGCGTGYVSAWLARAGARPVGIDLSEKQLATARANMLTLADALEEIFGNVMKNPSGEEVRIYLDTAIERVRVEDGAEVESDARLEDAFAELERSQAAHKAK